MSNAAAVNTTIWKADKPCRICTEDFNNGDPAVILGCGNGHVLCGVCYTELKHHDREAIANTYANTLWEAVRRNKGADKCLICCQMSHVSTEVIAQKFYTGKADDLIDLTK
jgi:hypothetical protein